MSLVRSGLRFWPATSVKHLSQLVCSRKPRFQTEPSYSISRYGSFSGEPSVESTQALEKKGEVGGSLDFVEEGLYDVFRAPVVALRKRLGDKALVDRWDVRHVVAGCYDLRLVRRVLDVVLNVFELYFQITHEARTAAM